MTKIKSINSNQLYIAQNTEVSLKLAGNTAQAYPIIIKIRL